jgi:cell division protein FtsI/penicillin-binding protein 2
MSPQVVSVTDRGGTNLASYGDAGLTTIANLLEKHGPPSGQGSPGLYVEIQTAAGKTVPNSQAVVVPPTNIPDMAITISARAENAARGAVAEHSYSSIVAIQPSSGKILAIANNDGYNDFAQSGNNAFDQWWPRLTGGRLAGAAAKYYGLNEPWDIGLGQSATYYRTPPGARGDEVAMEAFGEGAITTSPLAIASVAATVDSGTFRQPVLVPGASQRLATPLPASTDMGLKQMMRAVVSSGTAAGLGFGPDVYAKTGTADINGQEQPNSWFVAFDPDEDVAVACLVLNAGYGAQFAAPEVRSFLSRY